MKTIALAVLCTTSTLVMADSCLQTDKQGSAGDSRYYDYGRCKPTGPDNSYGAVNAIGQQMLGIMSRNSNSNSNDRGYSDAEREAFRRSDQAYKNEQNERRAAVKYGAWTELGGVDYSKYQYQNAAISDAQMQAVRTEIGGAISAGKLLDTYGGQNYEDPANTATWGSTDPVVRWKTCEVATQLARAYTYGEFINASQKNPAKGFAIAKAGFSQNCGGTSYVLGRIYEDGDKLVPGVDKAELGKYPKERIIAAYDVAILNGYTQAFERMAELYRLGGPERYRGKTYYVFPIDNYPYWRSKQDSDTMYLMRVQYSECLRADPANLVCARGLRGVYSDQNKDFLDGYTNYNQELAAYYTEYVTKLEGLLAKAGQPAAGAAH